MFIVWAIVVGLIVGAIARLIVPGKHPRGLIVTAVVGICGSLLATIAERAAGWSAHGLAPFVPSVIGAVVLLLALQALGGRGTVRS